MTSAEAGNASRVSSVLGSVRFRLTLLYSLLLFGLAALVVGAIYAGLARSLDEQPVSEQWRVTFAPTPDGSALQVDQVIREEIRNVEAVVNQRSLDTLRKYSFGALAALFVGSLGVGWFVAGRVLRPIGRITSVAREIQATDLSRRIDLEGPNDELRQLADTFDDMLARLDEAFADQRQFIHEASHELRNPLAVIRTNLDVALADPDATAEDLREAADIVGRSAERMSHVVDDLVTYARQGSRSLRKEPTDVSVVVSHVAREFEVPAETRGVALETRCEPVVGLWVIGDSDALEQAMANLVANAIRYAPVGSAVRLDARRHDAFVVASVTDVGRGIPVDQHDQVFQRFWRETQPVDDRNHSGLGLTIVRQIAEAHGGRVELRSEPDEGSVFSLVLPAARHDAPTYRVPAVPAVQAVVVE